MFAAVTGASGHLGAALIRALISQGWKVRALVHLNTRALDGIRTERVQADILDKESLKRAFDGVDIIFHLAARISIVKWDHEQVEAVNVLGVKNVVDAYFAAGVRRLIYVSSFHAQMQEPLDEPLDEQRALVTSSRLPPYNLSKAEGERIVRAHINEGLDAVIITPTGMIGPYDFQPSHFGAVLLNMAKGRLPASVDAGLDWVDTRDVAKGMIRASEHAEKGKKYILSGHWASLQDIAQKVAKFGGHNPPKIILPLWLAKTSAPLVSALDSVRRKRSLFTTISIKELECNRCLSHNRASKELGYDTRPLELTISDTLQWFRDNGYLTTTDMSNQ